jgi:hypothetical protein
MDRAAKLSDNLFKRVGSVIANAVRLSRKMNSVKLKPEARYQGDWRSGPLIAGTLDAAGVLTLEKTFVIFRIKDGAWLDGRNSQPISAQITHWVDIEDIDAVFGDPVDGPTS